MKKLIAVVAALFLLTGCIPGFEGILSKAQAWSLAKAHNQANKTLVNVGEWCSGTIVSDNKVVTAWHCLPIIKESRISGIKEQPYSYKFYEPVILSRHILDAEGNEIGLLTYKAVVYSYDQVHDVAILANVSDVKFTEWARINTAPANFGDKVYTIGNPHMWYGAVAEGTVVKPRFHTPELGGIPLIMHNASQAPGSSGGGLFNDKGELIGITNWSIPDTVYKLASPIENYVRLLNGLV